MLGCSTYVRIDSACLHRMPANLLDEASPIAELRFAQAVGQDSQYFIPSAKAEASRSVI